MKPIAVIILLLVSVTQLNAQSVRTITSGTNTSLRGLSVVDDNTIWVSGSNGTIGRSLDSGKTWKWMVVRGFEHADFRDIEGFDGTSAVVMGTSSPAYILRTDDGGSTWRVTFENKDSGMFLDGMYFWNEQSGIVVGDPVHGRFYIARTFDGGLHWRGIPEGNYPTADSGETCFAASGTNIRKLNNDEACFVSGGARSRLFIQNKQIDLPFRKGASIGANSIAVKNEKTFIVVGGDYLKPDIIFNTCIITKDGGKTWHEPTRAAPYDYESCVEYLNKSNWICCGPKDVYYTTDDGETWSSISSDGYNVCQKAKYGKAVFLAGENGIIARVIF